MINYECGISKEHFLKVEKKNKDYYHFKMKSFGDTTNIILEENKLQNLIKDLEEMINE